MVFRLYDLKNDNPNRMKMKMKMDFWLKYVRRAEAM